MTIHYNDVRPEVKAFAVLMEQQLRENDHKPGWNHERPDALLRRLREETEELSALIPLYAGEDAHEREMQVIKDRRVRIGEEAADVANFAMFIADVAHCLDEIQAQLPAPKMLCAYCCAELPCDPGQILGHIFSCEKRPEYNLTKALADVHQAEAQAEQARRELSEAKATAESAERQREVVANALGKVALQREEAERARDAALRTADVWQERAYQAETQLAGCSVAALGGTSDAVTVTKGAYGWSQAYQDVLDLRIKYHELQAQYEQEHVICEAATDNMIQDRLHRIPALESRVKALAQSARDVFNHLVLDDTYQYGYVMSCDRMYTAAKRLEEILNAKPAAEPSGVLNAASEVVEAFRRLGRCEDEFGSTSGCCGEYADAMDTRILALEKVLRSEYPCPGCAVQKYDKGNCALCGNLGYMLPAQRADILVQLPETGVSPNGQR